MAEKQAILDNVVQYSADQLVDFIRRGIVSMDELVTETDGQFDPLKRKKVKELLAEMGDLDDVAYKNVREEKTVSACERYLKQFPEGKFRDEVRDLKVQFEADEKAAEAWGKVDTNDESQLKKFVDDFPDSSYATEAWGLINEVSGGRITKFTTEDFVDTIHNFQSLRMGEEGVASWICDVIKSGKLGKGALLESLKEDHNLLSAPNVKTLTEQHVITYGDLQLIGIDDVYIKKMRKGETAVKIEVSSLEKFEMVNVPATEIYFWGIPSSGKSCALGAILSAANNGKVAKTMFPYKESQGYDYMHKLMGLFKNGEVKCLLQTTAIEEFFEMGFDLVDLDKKVHPIICIDMAGELMRCLYRKNARNSMDINEKAMLDTLDSILINKNTDNRKIHFFVVEYGAESKTYDGGLGQDAFLSGAMTYLKDTGVFKNNTDAIYILITKADKAKEQSKDAMKKYIMDWYPSFYNALEDICINNDINGQRVGLVAFTLGDVCFQDFCRFNSRPAESIVRLILERSYGKKSSKWEKFKDKIKA